MTCFLPLRLPQVMTAPRNPEAIPELSRSPAPAAPPSALTVAYTRGGSADLGDDYSTSPPAGSVTIPGGSPSATVTITPINDQDSEGSEDVVFTIAASSSYTIGSPASATVTIADNDLPTVTIAASDDSASEPGSNTGTFTFSRTGSTASALTVTYTRGGSADLGDDYSTSPSAGSLTIPGGSSSASVAIVPINDPNSEDSETVVFTIAASSSYTVGSPGSATVTIADDDLPTVTIAATDPTASEPNETGTFTFTRSGITAAALTVTYRSAARQARAPTTARPLLQEPSPIPSGSASATVTITPIDDFLVDGSETAVFTVASNSSYVAGSPASATVTIGDNDELPRVTIALSGASSVDEFGTGSATAVVSRTGPTVFPLTVSYALGGTASPG